MFEGSEETFIILQNTLLNAVTDISFDYQVNEEAIMLLANRGINRKINKPQTARCSFSKVYANRDFVQELTGATNISGQFVFGDKALDFDSAVITKYSISVKPTEIPKVSVDLEIYGDLKPTTNIRTGTASGDYAIKDLDVGSITLNLDDTNSAVTDFSYDVQFDVKPTYEIESIKSSTSRIISPIKYGCAANLEIVEQEFENMTGLINSEAFNRNISFSFIDKDLAILNTYSLPNASLASQEISIKAQDTIQVGVKYNGYSLLTAQAIAPSVAALDRVVPVELQVQDFESSTTNTEAQYMHELVGAYNTDLYDFESEATGATTGNLYDLSPVATDFQEEDFETTPTGDFDFDNLLENTFITEDFETTATGTTSANITYLGTGTEP